MFGCPVRGVSLALPMKASDIAIYLSGAVLVYITWNALGPSTLKPGGYGAPAEVRAALSSKLPVLLEFGATWCPPCRQVKPVIQELSTELQGRAHIVQIDVDERPDYAGRNGVSSIPCFVAMRDGKEIARKVGAISKAEMKQMLGL